MAAALEAAPGPLAESRAAITTTLRADSPGRVRIRLRSSTSLPSKLPVNRCSATWPSRTPSNRFSTMSAIAASPSLPGVRAGAVVDDLARDLGRGVAGRTPPAPPTGGSGAGGPWSENSSTTTADERGEKRGAVDAKARSRRGGANVPFGTIDRARRGQHGSARILLVDDEQSVQTLLTYPLRKDGYEVVAAHDGREALDRFAEQRFDLVVLDIMLPKLDGIEVCRRMRSRSQVPIIMLTAKDDEIDKVLGLEMGADDYITKPFSVREFRSRVRAALRRAEMLGGRPGGDEPIVAGDLRIDFERRAVTHARRAACGSPTSSSRSSPRSPARPGRVHTREMLLEQVWGDSAYRDPRTIDVHIRHLREKLERDPRSPEYLFTVRGVGYRFRDDEWSVRLLRSVSQPARGGVLRDHGARSASSTSTSSPSCARLEQKRSAEGWRSSGRSQAGASAWRGLAQRGARHRARGARGPRAEPGSCRRLGARRRSRRLPGRDGGVERQRPRGRAHRREVGETACRSGRRPLGRGSSAPLATSTTTLP